MLIPIYSKLVLAPWRASGSCDVVRTRPDERPFCEGCSDGAHDILRSCPVCLRTPVEKRAAREASGVDDRVYVLSGLRSWCVEGDGLFRPLFPIVLDYPTAFDALRAADATLRAHGVTLA
jgi:hypothetical protein